MRRHLSLTLTLLLLAATGVGAGIASAGASTPRPLVIPRTAVKIVAGTSCVPTATFCFKPKAKTVVSPTKVVFKNLTTTSHTVTRCSPAACSGVSGGTGTDTGFGSGTIAPGTNYKFVFRGTGTYTYYCTIHGYTLMHGTITVTP
jgi:plastocyanin